MARIRVVDIDGEAVATYATGYVNGRHWNSGDFLEEHAIEVHNPVQGRCEVHFQPLASDLRQLCLERLDDRSELVALPIPYSERQWAREFGDTGPAVNPAEQTIKVGVVDCVHHPLPEDLDGVSLHDWAGRAASSNLGHAIKNHGTDVCRIVRNSLGDELGPIEIEVFPLYADHREDESIFIPEDVLAGAINAAIDKGCRVINVSAGIKYDEFFSPRRVFDRVVRKATRHGVVIVAAGGNEVDEEVREPARYDEVLGIGMAGIVSHAARDTYTAFLMKKAIAQGPLGRQGHHPVLGDVFVAGAVGEGLNLVFPGCGLYCEGCMRMELHGSSFAAPVATRAIAYLYAGVPDEPGPGALAALWDRIRVSRRSIGVEPWCSTLKLGQSFWPT